MDGSSRLLAAFTLALFLIASSQSSLQGQSSAARAAIRAPDSPPSRLVLRENPGRQFERLPVLVRPPRRDPLPPTTATFPQIVRAAGIIFSGQVTAITLKPASGGQELATVAITFRVEHALLGAATGQNLTIHEWAGLWASSERFRVGERVFLFLYPPSRLGLTSPVAGPLGRFPVDRRGYINLRPQHWQAFWKDPDLSGRTSMKFAAFSRVVRGAREEE